MMKTPETLADKYRFIDFLGEGSNGKTWLAQTLIQSERVAIKSLKLSQIENLKSIDLFQREAEVLSSISVHGVPKFYEAIMDADGSGECYLIQQYIDAPSIQSYLDKGRKFSEQEALNLMRKVAVILRQLEMNYKPAIIHRDIKPSNILCNMPESSDNTMPDIDPWLIDFGAVANPQKRQQGSTVAGTVGYMAPEQIVGDNSIQADYYALGATILHMLTGVPPYQIPNELFVLQFKPVIKQNAPETSENMIELLDLLLQKDPTQRPKDIDELTRYIDNVMQQLSPTAKPEEHTSLLDRLRTHFNQIMHNFQTGSQSAQTNGYITAIRYIQGDVRPYVEFTYAIHDIYFTNASTIFFKQEQALKNLELPTECTVRYDPDNYAISSIADSEIESLVDRCRKRPKQNIKPSLYEPDSFIEDKSLKTPLALHMYELLGTPYNGLGWVAQNLATQGLCNIIPFKKSEYFNLLSKRIEIYSTPVVGLPFIFQTISDPYQPTTYLIRDYIDTPSLKKYLDADIIFYEEQVLYCLLKIAYILEALQRHNPSAYLGGIQPHYINISIEDILKTNLDAILWINTFFLSFDYHTSNHSDTGLTVKFGYYPPEMLLDRPGPTSDAYALGALALEMLTGVPPYEIPTCSFKLEFEGVLLNKAPHTSAPMVALLHILLSPKADLRPNASQLVTYIKNVMNGYFPNYTP